MNPASSDSKAAGLKCSVGSMALKQQMTLNAQRTSGLPQPTSRTTVTRSVKYSSVWGHSRPPVSLSPLCAGCPSAPGGLPQGWAWETDVSIMKEKHKQPLFQRVMCINTPDPKVEIKGKGASEPFISAAKNAHLGRHVTLVPTDEGCGHLWASHPQRGDPRLKHGPGVEAHVPMAGQRAAVAGQLPPLGAWGRPFLSRDVR